MCRQEVSLMKRTAEVDRGLREVVALVRVELENGLLELPDGPYSASDVEAMGVGLAWLEGLLDGS
jgi:hypothetical protein